MELTKIGNQPTDKELSVIRQVTWFGGIAMFFIIAAQILDISIASGILEDQQIQDWTSWSKSIAPFSPLPQEIAAISLFMTMGAILLIWVARISGHRLFELLEWLTVASGVVCLMGIPEVYATPIRLVVAIFVALALWLTGHVRTKTDLLGLVAVEVLGMAYVGLDPILLFTAGVLLVLYSLLGMLQHKYILLIFCSKYFFCLNIVFILFGFAQMYFRWEDSMVFWKEVIELF